VSRCTTAKIHGKIMLHHHLQDIPLESYYTKKTGSFLVSSTKGFLKPCDNCITKHHLWKGAQFPFWQ
jgi:hypothetical protein